MGFLSSFVGKVLVFLSYQKEAYLFYKSKKFISRWGFGTYGLPKVVCYDDVSRLSVGNYVSIASNVSVLLGANHKLGLVATYPRSLVNKNVSQEETNEQGDVEIGNDVWVGYGATIVGPVAIGDGAIIGAGAVVVRDVPAYSVAVGVPAKVVKFRFSDEQIRALKKIQWWNWSPEKIREAETLLFSSNIQAFIDKFNS